MTFSITGNCVRTAMSGVCLATSSIGAGSRCPYARSGIGAVSTQNVTMPLLGPRVLDAIAAGDGAQAAVDKAISGERFPEYRQLAAVDTRGGVGWFSGTRALGVHAVAPGERCVAAGNILANPGVPAAMARSFERNAHLPLPERLLAALESGAEAGGEAGQVRSAALLVAHDQAWPLVDLRCDWDDTDPIGTLRALWVRYEPQMEAYVQRALDPGSAPSYGVPGDA